MAQNRFLLKMIPCYLLALVLCLLVSQWGSRAFSAMIEHSPVPNRSCIVLDAGHGGIDGGALSCTGVPESQINLQIAQRLNDLLPFLGYKTLMLRTTDTSLHTQGNTIGEQKISDLKHRVTVVNDCSPTLLISVHQNTFSDHRYSGAQVFYCADPDSKALAQLLQNSFIDTINPGSNRKPKQAKGIYLMEHIQCPGILVECGFLTNENEEALLRDDIYQKKLSAVIAATVSSWQSLKNTPPTERQEA